MADDLTQAFPCAARMSLQDVKRAAQGLWAQCETANCGAETPIDPSLWEQRGLSRARLADLEPRLRCVCGARRARLRPGAPVATYGRGPIYPFS